MNLFRVPLNFLVVFVLSQVGQLENSTVFVVCSLWLWIGFALMHYMVSTIPVRVDAADL